MMFAPLAMAAKYDYLAEKFQIAYRWLAETDLVHMPPGRYPICDGVLAIVQEYTTRPAEEALFEAHDVHFDIQYVVSGKEQFGVCKREGLLFHHDDPEHDTIFFEEPEHCGSVLLMAGDLIVVAPEEAHKPRCMAGSPEPVRKVLVRVRI